MVEYEQWNNTQVQNKRGERKMQMWKIQTALTKTQQKFFVLHLLLHMVAVVSRLSEAEQHRG